MITTAAAEFSIDVGASYVIGDRWRDIDCARAARCRAIFVNRGYREPLHACPDFAVESFSEAVDVVLREIAAPLCFSDAADFL